MKKIQKYFLIMTLLFTAFSCYEDKSTLDTNPLPEVKITFDDRFDDMSVTVGYGDKLTIEPTVTKGGKENHSDLEYKWSLSRTTDPEALDFEELSTEKNFDKEILRAIESSDQYVLKYEVTDKAVDFTYSKYIYVSVFSSYGEGILVSYTEDGATSDLALIMDTPISNDYLGTEPNIRTGLYSAGNNGEKIPSLVTGNTYLKLAYKPSHWFSLESGELFKVNNEVYKREATEMIYQPDGFRAERFVTCYQYHFAFTPLGVYDMSKTLEMVPIGMSMTAENGGVPSNYQVSFDSHSQGSAPNMIWYNEEFGSFFHASSFSMVPAKYTTAAVGSLFDWANIPNKESKGAQISVDGNTHVHLLRDKTSGNYTIYGIARPAVYGESAYPSVMSEVPTSANSIIDNAVSIFFMHNYPVMFVATKTDIYAINFASSNATLSESRYSVSSGEIAVAKLYQQGAYMNDWSDIDYGYTAEHALNNKAVYIGVNDGNNGSVILIPIHTTLASSGVLETDASKMYKYEGFGKILDISTQGI